MNVLLVDHACHLRTKSFDFLRDLIARRHSVDVFHYETHYRFEIPAAEIAWADVVVFCEFLPSRFRLGVTGKRCVYVPMYDNEWGSKWLWKRLALLGMNVVSFCRKVGRHARACGVRNVLDVRFAFDPKRFADCAGNPRVLVLWERGDVTFDSVKRLFAPEDLDKVILVRRPAEGVKYAPVSPENAGRYHVQTSESKFLPQDEYFRFLSEPGVYVAPRTKEGIGMAFLEQVAMGKCVIAHDDATMNEYLRDGETGILTDMANPRRVSAAEVEAVRTKVRAHAETLYAEWLRDESRLLDFFGALESAEPLASPWGVRSIVWYALYWVEGAMMRLRERCA